MLAAAAAAKIEPMKPVSASMSVRVQGFTSPLWICPDWVK